MSTKKKTPQINIDAIMNEIMEGLEGPARMRVGLEALKKTVGRIADRLNICPLCLTYAFADKIMDAEDAGRVAHGRMRDDGVEDPFMPEGSRSKGSVH